ncbi:MAG: alpha/beta hydrolase family protein [Anaerolineales bacterium]
MSANFDRKTFRARAIAAKLGLCLALVASAMGIAPRADASGPVLPEPGAAGIAGLTSEAIGCLQTGPQSSGVVTLRWQGKAERARLVLTVSGSEAAHTIRLNGQPVAVAPVFPYGAACAEGRAFYLDVPVEAVKQGENLIEISNDRQPNDVWSAADARLEVWGAVSAPPAVSLNEPQFVSTLAVSSTINFINPYDSTSQQAVIQIPDGYNGGNATPLVIFAHGRYGTMLDGYSEFGAAANAQQWLLASPEMHGRWQGSPQPPSPGAFAYASLESQYDIIGALAYMTVNYNVDRSHVYLVGYSMGGQIAVVTAAKSPHIFAAVFDNKGPTDFTTWYGEQVANPNYGTFHDAVIGMRQECHLSGVPQPPAGNPFCYQRRSGLNFASNLIHVPISITHSIGDTLVPITHSRRLRDAVNALGPDQPVVVAENNICQGSACHSYDPNATDVLNFFAPRTLNNLPYTLNISTDESKAFYWLNVRQITGDRWTQVQAVFSPSANKVTATISDTQSVEVGFNPGSVPITGPGGFSQPGLGLSAKRYQITVNNAPPYLQSYVSGYLTVTVPSGQVPVTIVAAYPVYLPVVSKSP